MARKRRKRRINIGGVAWRLDPSARLPKDRWGDCDPPQKRGIREIRVSEHACGEQFVDTLFHELTHARWWALCETEVREFVEEAVAILKQFPEEVLEMLEEEESLTASSPARRRATARRERGGRGSPRKTSPRSADSATPSTQANSPTRSPRSRKRSAPS